MKIFFIIFALSILIPLHSQAAFETLCHTNCVKQDDPCHIDCVDEFAGQWEGCRTNPIPNDCKNTAKNNLTQCTRACRDNVVVCLEKCQVTEVTSINTK